MENKKEIIARCINLIKSIRSQFEANEPKNRKWPKCFGKQGPFAAYGGHKNKSRNF